MPHPHNSEAHAVNKPFNPYRSAAYYVAERLAWDMNPESWRSRSRLKAIQNQHFGKSIVILCNGPSLNAVNLDSLKGIPTIGLNKINLLFNRGDFRPNYIVAVNKLVIEQNSQFFNSTDLPIFIGHGGISKIARRDNVTFLHSVSFGNAFARDASISVNESATVTVVALQLAYHLGYRRVALVGADHSFAQKGPPNSTATAQGADENHFDPNYFADGARWQLADLAQSEVGYRSAREAFEAAGGSIVNATQGGFLEIFPRQSLEQFLADADGSKPHPRGASAME